MGWERRGVSRWVERKPGRVRWDKLPAMLRFPDDRETRCPELQTRARAVVAAERVPVSVADGVEALVAMEDVHRITAEVRREERWESPHDGDEEYQGRASNVPWKVEIIASVGRQSL